MLHFLSTEFPRERELSSPALPLDDLFMYTWTYPNFEDKNVKHETLEVMDVDKTLKDIAIAGEGLEFWAAQI